MSIVAGGTLATTRRVIAPNVFATDTHNLMSFKQEAIVTFNGNQYFPYYDVSGNVMIAKRNLTTEILTIADTGVNWSDDTDSHDDIVIGIDTDGFIHISWGMHAESLRYIRSNNAEDITSFSSASMVGVNEDSVTYPKFFLANNVLFFSYRNGGSSIGHQYLNKYDTVTKTWSALHHKFVNGGTWSAYSDNFTVGHDGKVHHTVMWRSSNTPTILNDYTYIYSTDNCQTWRKENGDVFTMPLHYDTNMPFIAGDLNGLVNQQWNDVDGNSRPHVAYWKMASNGHYNYFHIWYNGTSWTETQLTFRTDTPTEIAMGIEKPIARAGIICNRNTNTVYVFTRLERGGYIFVYKSVYPYTDWTYHQLGNKRFGITEFGIFDRGRFYSTGILDFIAIHNEKNPQPLYLLSTNLIDLQINKN